ncbi:integral membrane sensor signal transduction histidine kinase [Calothrix sp. NIES-4071]|nr:integral membrane sensor signal transduction histidine kinase [Calothrix sp. NIES-4071]BAZ55393.1 integral membrane sensor signal transduction histidine kinase [Calothrix sp. NIES-4105]
MFTRSRRNLAYLFALSMGGILVVFAGVAYYFGVEQQLKAFDEYLYGRAKNFVSGRFDDGALRDKLDNLLPSNTDLTYKRWYNSQGQLIWYQGALPDRILTASPDFQTIYKTIYITQTKQRLREVTLPVRQNKYILVGYVQIATPLTSVEETVNRYRLFLSIGLPITFIIIGITGWFLGGLAMQPTRRAYDQLQRFTADASHELRAPIAAMLSNAQVALMPPYDESEQQFRLENIIKTAKSMSSLVSNLLFLSRHEGALDLTTLPTVNLVELLKTLASEYQSQNNRPNFTVQLIEKPIYIKADADLLKQAVINLLDNAFKYTPADKSVELKLLLQPHGAIIQVKDNGVGIPSEDLPHIFERFYRVDKARTRNSGGFGLGLAIVKQIVQAHQGHISVNSVLGQGSTFQVQLPLI